MVVQPISGAWLVWRAGYDWTGLWLLITYALYALAGACWLPVVWIQVALKNMLTKSRVDGTPLPARYHQLFRLWFLLGWPAFLSLLVIFYVMISKSL